MGFGVLSDLSVDMRFTVILDIERSLAVLRGLSLLGIKTLLLGITIIQSCGILGALFIPPPLGHPF
jgi:hypothetical protein